MATRILVVDDDPDILDAIQFLLVDAGYQVTVSEKGEYAENLRDQNGGLPDLILLDVLLSGKDGRTICKHLKEREDTRAIPIIMIAANPAAEASVREVGADDFVAKPFDVDYLLERIEAHLGQKELGSG